MACDGQGLLHPGHYFFGQESFILDIGVHGVIGVPGVDPEGRLDDRQVILVLRVGPAQGFQSVVVGVIQPELNREHVQEIVRHPGGRVGGSQNPHHLGAGPVIRGNDLVPLDPVGVGAHVDNLESGRPGGIPTRPVISGARAVSHDAGRAPGEAGVRGREALDAVLKERDRGAESHELQLGPGGQRPGTVSFAELYPVPFASLEQDQFRMAVIPIVDADVSVLPAVLRAHGRPDPLGILEAFCGDFNLGILIAAKRPSGPDVAGDPGAPGHRVRRDRQCSVTDTGPIRPQAAGRLAEIIRSMCRRESFLRKHQQRDKNETEDRQRPHRPQRPKSPDPGESPRHFPH